MLTRTLLALSLVACGPVTDHDDPPPPAACMTELPTGPTTLPLDCAPECEAHELTVPTGSCAVVTSMDATGKVLACVVFEGKREIGCVEGGSARIWVEGMMGGACERRC